MKSYLLSFIFTITASCAFAQGSAGLIAHWNFNGNANDVSGNNLNGVVTGASLTTGYSGAANTAYKFKGETVPGITDHIDVPYDPITDVQEFAICALVKADKFNSANCQNNMIFWRGMEDQYDYLALFMTDGATDGDCQVHTPGKYGFFTGLTDLDNSYGPLDKGPHGQYVSPNTWYCVVTTYDGVNISTYVNGALYFQLPFQHSPTPNNTIIRFGASLFSVVADDWRAYPFYGTMDDIKFYGRSLSASEADMYCEEVKAGGHSGGDDGDGGSTDGPTSVKSLDNGIGFILAPNPANNRVQVLLQKNANGKAQLINTLGQVLAEKAVTGNSVQFDLDAYAPGVYMVRLQADGEIATQRFLKQ